MRLLFLCDYEILVSLLSGFELGFEVAPKTQTIPKVITNIKGHISVAVFQSKNKSVDLRQ